MAWFIKLEWKWSQCFIQLLYHVTSKYNTSKRAKHCSFSPHFIILALCLTLNQNFLIHGHHQIYYWRCLKKNFSIGSTISTTTYVYTFITTWTISWIRFIFFNFVFAEFLWQCMHWPPFRTPIPANKQNNMVKTFQHSLYSSLHQGIDISLPDALSLLTSLGNGNFIWTEEDPVQPSFSWNQKAESIFCNYFQCKKCSITNKSITSQSIDKWRGNSK